LLVYSFLISLLNVLTTHTLLTRKKSIAYCIVVLILNTIVVNCAAIITNEYIHNPIVTKYALTFIAFMYIIYIQLVFSESFHKKIFTMFSIWILSLITLSISIPVSESFSKAIDIKYIQTLSYYLRFFIQTSFLLASYFWLSKPYKRVISLVSNKTITFMSSYLIIAFFLLINNYTSSFKDLRNFQSTYDLILFLIFTILGYIIVFTGISSSSETILLQCNYKFIEKQIELQQQNYKKLNESLEQLYVIKHDARHHISVIEIMVQQQKYKEVLDYIVQFNQNELSKNVPMLCSNFTADSIIKYYMGLAISKNIDFKTNIIIPEDIGIEPLDLCVVLGNCLENALEACDKLNPETSRWIELSSKIVGFHIVFMISNNFDGKIIKMDNTIRSSKGGQLHGIGLSSISQTVAKYNGNIDIKHTDKKFEISIIM
jgi:two-component system, LytTR family, sensor histidine kinase AgrC